MGAQFTGYDVERIRKSCNLTQREMAEKIGVAEITLRKWESDGKSREIIKPHYLAQLALLQEKGVFASAAPGVLVGAALTSHIWLLVASVSPILLKKLSRVDVEGVVSKIYKSNHSIYLTVITLVSGIAMSGGSKENKDMNLLSLNRKQLIALYTIGKKMNSFNKNQDDTLYFDVLDIVLGGKPKESKDLPLGELRSLFRTPSEKKQLLLELVGLAYTDGEYTHEEDILLLQIADELKLETGDLLRMKQLISTHTKLIHGIQSEVNHK